MKSLKVGSKSKKSCRMKRAVRRNAGTHSVARPGDVPALPPRVDCAAATSLPLIDLAVIWYFWILFRSEDDPILKHVPSSVWKWGGVSFCVIIFSRISRDFSGRMAESASARTSLHSNDLATALVEERRLDIVARPAEPLPFRSGRSRAGSRTRRSPRVEQVEPRLAVDGDQPLQQAVARLDGRPAVGAVAGLVHAPLARLAPPVRGAFGLPRARERQRARAAERDPALPLN